MYELKNVQSVKNLDLPSQSLGKQVKYIKHLNKIPLNTYDDATPRILIGQNNGFVTNTLKLVEGRFNEPCASKTRLGWVVHGGYSQKPSAEVFHINSCECSKDLDQLNQQISQYLSLENACKPYYLKSTDDMRAEILLESTTKRVKNGYQTGLLWKQDVFDVPDSYQMSFKRLQCLERKLKPNELVAVNIKFS